MVNRRSIAFITATAAALVACGAEAPPASPTVAASAASPGPTASAPGIGTTCVVAVSWADETGRWGTWDEPALRKVVEAAGARYVATDAASSEVTQAANIASLVAKGATVLIVVAQDGTAIEPSVASAHQHGIPVIAYDRLIDDADSLYVSFDNVEVGRMQARALLHAVPTGDYAFIKGDEGDANSDLLRSGQAEVLAAAVASGAVRSVGETYTDNWDPALAQTEMESILAANGNKVDAVLAQNDGMAGGVIAALAAHGLAGTTAVSGQDGDEMALNDVALGRQTVDVWKDARLLGAAAGHAAVQLCGGTPVSKITDATDFTTPAGTIMRSILLAPVAVTRDDLPEILASGWITKQAMCLGVAPGVVPACT